jgi:hypothetical protein
MGFAPNSNINTKFSNGVTIFHRKEYKTSYIYFGATNKNIEIFLQGN